MSESDKQQKIQDLMTKYLVVKHIGQRITLNTPSPKH